MKCDESSMSESFTSKTLMKKGKFSFTPLKIIILVKLSCGHKGWKMYSFSLTTGVRGFHVYNYKDVWVSTIARVSFI